MWHFMIVHGGYIERDRLRELSTITAVEGGGLKYFWELKGATQYFNVHGFGGGSSKNILGYSTSKMHINTTAKPCSGVLQQKKSHIQERPDKM